MEVFEQNYSSVDNFLHTQVQHNLTLRCGSIASLYEDGYLYIRNFCFQTTIPVTGGMSGGAVFRLSTEGAMKPFAIISWSSKEDNCTDRSIPGSMVASRLKGRIVKKQSDLKQEVQLLFPSDFQEQTNQ